MFKNLIKEALKNEFFNDKDKIINDYLAKNCEGSTQRLTYTHGKVAIVDLGASRVYSRNGFFYSVILKDDYYINDLNEEEYLTKLDNYYQNKYFVEDKKENLED